MRYPLFLERAQPVDRTGQSSVGWGLLVGIREVQLRLPETWGALHRRLSFCEMRMRKEL